MVISPEVQAQINAALAVLQLDTSDLPRTPIALSLRLAQAEAQAIARGDDPAPYTALIASISAVSPEQPAANLNDWPHPTTAERAGQFAAANDWSRWVAVLSHEEETTHML